MLPGCAHRQAKKGGISASPRRPPRAVGWHAAVWHAWHAGGAGAVHQECAEENSQRSGLQKLRIEPLLRRYSVLTLPTWAVAVGLHFWTVFHDNIRSGKLPSGRRRGRTNPEACACRACRRVEPSMQPSPTRTVDDRKRPSTLPVPLHYTPLYHEASQSRPCLEASCVPGAARLGAEVGM